MPAGGPVRRQGRGARILQGGPAPRPVAHAHGHQRGRGVEQVVEWQMMGARMRPRLRHNSPKAQ